MKPSSLSRRSATLAVTALLTVTLAACGSDDETPTATDTAPTTSSETPTETPSEDAGSDAPTTALPAWAPAIVTDGDKVTGLDFTDTPEPTDELLVATVTEGDGPPVEVGQDITANYFGSLYGSDTPFDESFSGTPFTAPIGVGSLIAGWDQKIPGIPVGSRIIMSIPPEFGYGDRDSGPIPAGSTLYFVIDILAAS